MQGVGSSESKQEVEHLTDDLLVESLKADDPSTSSGVGSVDTRKHVFAFGSQVRIHSLKGESAYNNSLGFVCGDLKLDTGRFPIRLANTNELVLVKACNLQVICGPIAGIFVEPFVDISEDSDSDNTLDTSESGSSGWLTEEESSDTENSDSQASAGKSEAKQLTQELSDSLNLTSELDKSAKTEVGTDIIMKSEEALVETTHVKVEQKSDVCDSDTVADVREEGGDFKSADDLSWISQCSALLRQWTECAPRGAAPPSLVSTASTDTDCGLRWAPVPVTEDISAKYIRLIGAVTGIVEGNQLIVGSSQVSETSATRLPLAFDSILCLSDRTVVGRVDDIMGVTKQPSYLIRLSPAKMSELLLGDAPRVCFGVEVFAVCELSALMPIPDSTQRFSSDSAAEYESDTDSTRVKVERSPPRFRAPKRRGSTRRRGRGRFEAHATRGSRLPSVQSRTQDYNDMIRAPPVEVSSTAPQEPKPEDASDPFSFLL